MPGSVGVERSQVERYPDDRTASGESLLEAGEPETNVVAPRPPHSGRRSREGGSKETKERQWSWDQLPPITRSHSSASKSSLENTASEGDEEPDDFLDGGAVAWRQVVAGHFANAVACGYDATFGIFQLYYTQKLGLGAAKVAWIGSVEIFLSNGVCILAGRLTDAGYGRETVFAGSCLVVLGTFMTSIATEYWHIFLAQGVLTGLGLGLVWMPAMAIINTYFDKRRSLALTCASAGTGTGSLIFPATVQYLIPQVGFAWAVRTSGFVVLAMLIILNLLLRPRKSAGTVKAMVELKAFKEKPFVLFIAGAWLVLWVMYFGYFYINSFAMTLPNHAFTETSAVKLLLLTNAVGTPARVIVGWVADNHLGALNTFIISVVAFGLTIYAWASVETSVGLYAWAAVFGVTSGAAHAGYVAGLGSMAGDGTRFGMACTIVAFATLAGPPTAGAIIDLSGGVYKWAQVWGGSVELLGALVLCCARCFVSSGLWVAV